MTSPMERPYIFEIFRQNALQVCTAQQLMARNRGLEPDAALERALTAQQKIEEVFDEAERLLLNPSCQLDVEIMDVPAVATVARPEDTEAKTAFTKAASRHFEYQLGLIGLSERQIRNAKRFGRLPKAEGKTALNLLVCHIKSKQLGGEFEVANWCILPRQIHNIKDRLEKVQLRIGSDGKPTSGLSQVLTIVPQKGFDGRYLPVPLAPIPQG